MKTAKISILVFVMALLSACANKMSDEVKADIDQFSNDWQAMSTNMAGAMETLNSTAAGLDNSHNEIKANIPGDMNSEMMSKAAEHMARCEASTEALNKLKEEGVAAMANMETMTSEFAAWKNDVDAGKVKEEDAKAKLDSMRANMGELQAKMDAMMSAMNEEMEKEGNNHAEMSATMAMMSDKNKM